MKKTTNSSTSNKGLERLQKTIAAGGEYSRREAERMILEGRVKVNSEKILVLGTKVAPQDQIEIDGRSLEHIKKITLAFYKPRGFISSRKDPYEPKTLYTALPKKYHHLKPIGRLDKDSEGLILLSNDGELIQKLTHPRFGHQKIYEVLVKGIFTEKHLQAFQKGDLRLDGKLLQKMQVVLTKTEDGKSWLKMTLKEGKKRQIRRVLEQMGFKVLILRRTHIGQLSLEGLAKGKYRLLSEQEIAQAVSKNLLEKTL